MRSLLSRLNRWLSWHRRPVAAVAAAVAVLAVIMAVRPADPPQTPVVVMAAERPGGHQLTAGDVQVVDWPRSLVPDEPVGVEDVIGRTLTAPLAAGSPLTQLSVLSEHSAASAGMVVIPVHLADPSMVTLLRPGERIDLLGVDSSGMTAVIAASVRLVSVPSTESTAGGFAPAGTSSSMILVEVSPETAIALTDASHSGPISALLR